MTPPLYQTFQRIPLASLVKEWDAITDKDTNRQAMRELCKWDRFYLLTKVLRRPDMMHPWVYARCREVERSPNGFLDLWAREHYKSTIITFGGIIQAILQEPETTVCIFSHTSPIAKSFLAPIKREAESNTALKVLFPDIFWDNPQAESPQWSMDAGIILKRKGNPKEATVEAHGLVDSQPISKHYSLRVYDDVVVPESVSTPEQIAKTTAAWELSDNLGTVDGRRWHAGTRYSYADTYEAIMKRGALTARIYPATADGEMDGKPVLFTKDEWERRKRDQGEATVACQLLLNPLAGSQRMFNVEDLQVYEVRPHTLNAYIMVDPARSKKKDSANTAMVVLGVDYAGNKYLLDGFNHKMDLQERWARLKELYLVWRQQPGIQSCHAGYEKFGAQSDFDYFQERMRVERLSMPLVELEWPREGDGSKVDRVQRLGPDIRSGKFYLPHPTDANTMTKQQRQMETSGYKFRVSRAIKRKDHEGNIYDLAEQFRVQLHYFPFGGLKDLVDAASRIYDMEPTPPIMIDERSLEPEVV